MHAMAAGCMFQPDGTSSLNRTAWLNGNFPSGHRNLGWPLRRLKKTWSELAGGRGVIT